MSTKYAIRRTPEEALRASVDAIGGLQDAGHELKPERDPILAGQWLSHCLTAGMRDKLSLEQIVFLFRRANALAEHDGFQVFAELCGYAATPIAPTAQFADAVRNADAAIRDAHEAARDLQTLIDNPRLLATMRAIGLKVDA